MGVPLITQVEVLILRPTERAGVATQFVIAAPLLVRVVGETDMATPMLPEVPVAPEKLRVGTPATTTSVTEAAVDDPAEFVATIE